jgi:hypothetical protein
MKSKKQKSLKKSGGKKLAEQAGLAIKHEFYLEASWLLSALFERRFIKIFHYLDWEPAGTALSFSQMVNKMKGFQTGGKYPDLTGCFREGLIEDIRSWKNQRNDILKDMPRVRVTQARLERLATEGALLYKDLNEGYKTLKNKAGSHVLLQA